MPSLYLVRNIFSNYALLIVSGLLGLFLTPLLFHFLQPNNYAVYVFALTMVTVLGNLDLGLFSTLIRFVSDLAARGLSTELKRLASTAFYFLAALGAFLSLLLLMLCQPLSSFFRLDGNNAAPGYLVIALSGLTLLFELPSTALRAFLEGCQDFHLANAVDILVPLLRAVLMVILLLSGFGLLAIAALFPTTALVRLVGMLVAARHATIPFQPSLGEVEWASLRRTREFASLAFFADTFVRWFLQLDKFLAARLLSLSDLAILSISRRIPFALKDVYLPTFSVTYPLVSSAAARQDERLIQKFLILTTRNLLAVALPFALALLFWAEVILRLWIGEEVLTGVPIFRVLVPFAVLAALQEAPLTLLYGVGKIRFNTALSGVLLVAGVVAGAWACAWWGLLGLAVAYTSVQGVGTLLLYRHVLPLVQVRTRQWFRKAVAPPLWAALPTAAWLSFSYWLVPRNVVGLAISIIPSFLLFFGLFVRLVVGPEKPNWNLYTRRLLTEID